MAPPLRPQSPRARSDAASAQARERMFALLSHEIRTPLNGVLGMASLLAATDLDAAQAAYLQTLRDCGEHLLGLVNDTLDFAKLEAGRVELDLGEVDVEALLQSVCELLSPKARAQGIEIAWAVEAGVPPLLADEGRLRQILFNLAGNAVKLTQAGGVVLTVSSLPAVDAGAVTARFEVRDTGPGLAAGDVDGIFEEFVQTQAGARAGGAGLGLAIVKRLAQAMSGRLGVASEPGRGALFWFEAQFLTAGPPVASGDLAGLRICVRSPNAVVREAAGAQIRAAGGAFAPEPALQPAPQPAPQLEGLGADVVLVDGVDAAPSALAPGGVPALVLVAPEARDRIATYRQAGYAGYLVKPLRRTSLVAQVLAALGRSRSDHPTPDERESPAPVGGDLRVLLAEDNAVNALLARAMLTRAGCSVEQVATGEDAVAATSRTPFDLIFMDVRMPGIGGLEATRRLREGGYDGPIVALTANAFDDDRRACRQAGMTAFLSKPMDPDAMSQVLARARALNLRLDPPEPC